MELNFENLQLLRIPTPLQDVAPNLFALVDHSALPELTQKLDRFGLQWKSLFEGSRDEGALKVAPILLSVDVEGSHGMKKSAWEWICDRARFTSSLLFIESPHSLDALGRRLTARLDATLPHNLDIVLRYFDCRVFASLLDVLDENQKATFLSAGSRWSYVDRAGIIQSVNSTFCGEDRHDEVLVFNSSQETALIDASEPDRVALLLNTVAPSDFLHLNAGLKHNLICKTMMEARQLSIVTTADIAFYCSLAFANGPEFYKEADWLHIFEQVRIGKLSLVDAIESKYEQ